MKWNALALAATLLAMSAIAEETAGPDQIVERAHVLQAGEPEYPATERRYGHVGRVIVRAAVAADGSVGDVGLEESSGWLALDFAALRSVPDWKFTPAKNAAGNTVASNAWAAVNYKLEPVPDRSAQDAWQSVRDALTDYRVYERSTNHLLAACDGLGLDTATAKGLVIEDVRLLQGRITELLQYDRDNRPAAAPQIDFDAQWAVALARYEENIRLERLAIAPTDIRSWFCRRIVDDVIKGNLDFKHFSAEAYHVLSDIKLERLRKKPLPVSYGELFQAVADSPGH
jgi:periplasmic protein TonB